VTLSLPTALHEALRAESRRTGTPMSRIVSDAVREKLGRAKPVAKPLDKQVPPE